MERIDRVALLAILWFAGWTLTGDEIGRFLGQHWTGAVWGFFFAMVSMLSWPWVLPDFIERWLYDPTPEETRIAREGRWAHWRVMSHSMFPQHTVAPRQTGIHRIFIVAGLWFAFWMIAAAVVGKLMSDIGNRPENIYFGFFNGAWWALLTSFAWPWIMPSAVARWMYRY